MNWRNAAACRGVGFDVFYPDGGGSYAQAREFCARCPVRKPCLADAMRWEAEYDGGSWVRAGMAGGLTPQERRAIA